MRTIIYFPTNFIRIPVKMLEEENLEEKMIKKDKQIHQVSRKNKSYLVNVSYGVLLEDLNVSMSKQKETNVKNMLYS